MKRLLKIRLILIEKLPFLSFLISLFALLILFKSLLLPLSDSHLNFAYGDFSAIIGANSGLEKYQMIFHMFNQRWGAMELHLIRRFMLEGGIAALTKLMPAITDSQIASVAILISIILGCYGVFRLCCLFEKEKYYLSTVNIEHSPTLFF